MEKNSRSVLPFLREIQMLERDKMKFCEAWPCPTPKFSMACRGFKRRSKWDEGE